LLSRVSVLVDDGRSLQVFALLTEEISYFEVASYLAEIEAEYAEISDPIEQTQQLVARLQEKWPALTASQAVAYVRVFKAG
jgi:hypothetical protein